MKEMMLQLQKNTNFSHSIFIYENNYKESPSIIGVNIIYEIHVFFRVFRLSILKKILKNLYFNNFNQNYLNNIHRIPH